VSGYIVFQLILMATSSLSSVLLVSCAKYSKVTACTLRDLWLTPRCKRDLRSSRMLRSVY